MVIGLFIIISCTSCCKNKDKQVLDKDWKHEKSLENIVDLDPVELSNCIIYMPDNDSFDEDEFWCNV